MPNPNSGTYGTEKGVLVQTVTLNGVSSMTSQLVSASRGWWTRSSVQTPGFRGQKFNHLDLPMNGFHFENERNSYCHGSKIYQTTYEGTPYMYQVKDAGLHVLQCTTPSISSNDSALLTARSSQKLLTGLKDQNINLGVAAAEGKQVVNMIANTATKLAGAGFAMKRGDLAGAAQALGISPKGKKHRRPSTAKNLANNWLELQYGWMPLLSDIYGGAQYLANQKYRPPRTKLTSSSTKTGGSRTVVKGDLEITTDTISTTHTVKYVVYFSEPLGGNPPVALGLTNPFAIAWELVPFSFVVDWFLPVGSYLSNIDATSGQTFIKGCKTEFWRGLSRRVESGNGYVIGTRKTWVYKHLEATKEVIFCDRTKLNGFPTNKVPSFKNPLSGAHVANAMALLAQAFRR